MGGNTRLDSNDPTSPKTVGADLKSLRAAQIRAEGNSYVKIAAQMTAEGTPITASGAYRAVQRALRFVRQEMPESAIDARDLDLMRLDDMLVPHLKKAIEEVDARSAEVAIRLMDRRAKYLGLDDPGNWPRGSSGESEAPGSLDNVAPEKLQALLEAIKAANESA